MLAVDQIVEIRRSLAPLPRQHLLAPKEPRYKDYYSFKGRENARITLPTIIGRIVATPQLILRGRPLQPGEPSLGALYSPYIIRTDPLHPYNKDDIFSKEQPKVLPNGSIFYGPKVLPDHVLPANPGYITDGAYTYREVRQEPLIIHQ